ncbi:hypothetical protein GOV08_04625 [Candidatus Woesearchaeota archaeon]|nr:hypothetical protein [Candidatus Woesearchaeota archaeon]
MKKSGVILILSIMFLLTLACANAITYDMNPQASFRFLQSSQNIEQNKFNDLKDVYYYLSIYHQTGKINEIYNKSFFIERIQSFQNADGGFGDWAKDRSKAGSTRIALISLSLLGENPLNKSSLKNFLYELQVSNLAYGNYGFKSSFRDSDADLSSTYAVIYSLNHLGFDIPNKNGVIAYLKDHQNEDGGFGLQTNRKSGIFWTSTLTHTRRGLEALDILGEKPDFYERAISFVQSRQSSSGGFSNKIGESPKVTATYNSILSFEILEKQLNNIEAVENFIKNNQKPNGGFTEYSLDNKEGIHTTYYAAASLDKIKKRYDDEKMVGYAKQFIDSRLDGGFGNYPGLESTLRSTFNAVSSLNLIGKKPLNKTLAIDFIESFRNPDGGYGQNRESNVEATYRAALTLTLLGAKITDKDKVIQYIKSIQNNDGGFGFARNSVSRVSYTYRAVRSLQILGSKPSNVNGAIAFSKSAQNPDGGFSNNVGDKESGPGSTYRALRALEILDSSSNNPNKAKEYVLRTKNSDGGFKKSPNSLTWPENISKSVYAYDAILSLDILGSPIENDVNSLNYIKQLRNPDLAFSPVIDFTSEASSTFTSLWSYYYLAADLNSKPELRFSKVEYFLDEDNHSYIFSTRFYDNDSQLPEYVHLVIDGERHLMNLEDDNLKGERYVADLDLALGDYNYYFEASDGIDNINSDVKTFSVVKKGDIPNIIAEADNIEGTIDTLFNFKASIENIELDKLRSVQIKFNDGVWGDMNKTEGVFIYKRTFNPGIYTYKVKIYDGVNVVTSKEKEIKVHENNISKPEWSTFVKIKDLIASTYGKTILYGDVNKEILNGNIYWNVALGTENVYVDYVGEKFYGEKSKNNMLIYLITGFLVLMLSAIFMIYKKRRQ